MQQELAAKAIPYGLLELDAEGNVCRYCPIHEDKSDIPASEIYGRNFFTEVMPFAQLLNFQSRFQSFMADGDSIDKFNTAFASDGAAVRVQVLMAHITERSQQSNRRLALVRITSDAAI